MTMFWVFSFFFPIIIYTFLALYLRVLKVYFMRLKLCPNFLLLFLLLFVMFFVGRASPEAQITEVLL